MKPFHAVESRCCRVGCFSTALAVVGHCLAAKYFIGKLPAARWVWVNIGWAGDERATKEGCKTFNLIRVHLTTYPN